MTIGQILIILYWVIFTLRHGFKDYLHKRAAQNAHERRLSKRAQDESRIEAAEHELKKIKRLLRVLKAMGWIQSALLILAAAWLVLFLTSIIKGGFVLLGFPV